MGQIKMIGRNSDGQEDEKKISYNAFCFRKGVANEVFKLMTPNETRVGGCYNIFVSILRRKPLLQIISNNAWHDPSSEAYCKVALTMTEYDRVAQFESVFANNKASFLSNTTGMLFD